MQMTFIQKNDTKKKSRQKYPEKCFADVSSLNYCQNVFIEVKWYEYNMYKRHKRFIAFTEGNKDLSHRWLKIVDIRSYHKNLFDEMFILVIYVIRILNRE